MLYQKMLHNNFQDLSRHMEVWVVYLISFVYVLHAMALSIHDIVCINAEFCVCFTFVK